MDNPVLTICTIGHSNQSFEEFVALLRASDISLLVDVRSAPYSKYSPQFSQTDLKLGLEANNIGYRYAGDYLGGRPESSDLYKNHVLPDAHADYLNLVDYPKVATTPRYQLGIKRLLELAATDTIAIMCSEEDPLQCHRHHLITQTLLERGVTVVHLRRNGAATLAESISHQIPLL